MTAAETIVQRLIAKKYPTVGRYCFEQYELVQVVEAIQADARGDASTITFDLYYDVRSPRGTVWHRHAGPFQSLADARTHQTRLDAGQLVNWRIVETNATTCVVAQEER